MRRRNARPSGADALPAQYPFERLGKIFLLGVGLFALVFIGSRVVDLHQLRQAELERSEREGESFVAVFVEYVRTATQGIGLAFVNLDQETRFIGGASAPAERWDELLGATVAANEEILEIYAVGPDNVVRQSTDRSAVGVPLPSTEMLDRARGSEDVVFGPPLRCLDCPSPYVLQVARRMTGEDGEFAGAIVAQLDAKGLRAIATTLGDRFLGNARLVMDDGTLMVAEPPQPFPIGSALPQEEVERWRSDIDGYGTAEVPGRDGGTYLVSYGRMPEYGLWVTFYRDRADILATWWQSFRTSVIGSALSLLAFAFGAAIYASMLNTHSRTERAARMRASELASIQRAAGVTALRWYPHERRLSAAPGAMEVLGLERDETSFTLDEFLELFPEDASGNVRAAVEDSFATGGEHRMEATLIPRGEKASAVHLALTLFRIEDVGQPHVLIACSDHSRWQEMRVQHAHLMRMDAVGQITGGVAHDFNNLLVLILGNLEELVDTFDRTDPRHGLADVTFGAAMQARELTKRLLAFARRQPLRPTIVDIRGLVEGMGPILRRFAGENATLGLNAEPGVELWKGFIDRTQLENAVTNLVLNARDALVGGHGNITVHIRNKVIRPDDAGGVTPGEYVEVAVEDNGVGMDEEVADRSIEPYFTTKPPGEGSGLGLSMVYGFVKQSGGHFRVFSEKGTGTIVRLFLPKAVGASLALAAAREEDDAGGVFDFGTETILLVEDEEKVRKHIERVLTSMGYRVISRLDGRSALRLVDEGAEFDLLLTDVVLPNGMDGPMLAREVHKRHPEVPVLFASGYAKDMVAEAGLSPDLNFLAKPFVRNELARKVRDALDSAH